MCDVFLRWYVSVFLPAIGILFSLSFVKCIRTFVKDGHLARVCGESNRHIPAQKFFVLFLRDKNRIMKTQKICPVIMCSLKICVGYKMYEKL